MKALQTEGNEAQILLVDNGSSDGSVLFMKEHYPEVDCICFTENRGFCEAVNAGIKAAKTPYVLLLNNDTEVFQNFVGNLEKAIEKSEKIFSVSSRMLVQQQPQLLDGAGDLYCALGWAYSRLKGKDKEKANKPCRIFAACGGASLYRKSVFDEIGLFDTEHFAYLEDLDIGYRAKIYGYENWYEPSAEVLHAGSGFSGSRYNEFKTRLSSRNSIYLIYKNMPFLQILLNIPFLLIGFFVKTLFFMRKGLGKIYVKGLLLGMQSAFRQKTKVHKVHFSVDNMENYCRIQLELWINTIKRICF